MLTDEELINLIADHFGRVADSQVQFARAIEAEVIKRCAKICKDSERYRGEYFAAKILEMK